MTLRCDSFIQDRSFESCCLEPENADKVTMKITIAKEQIISGLQAVQNIVGSRTTLPILSNVLLKAEEYGRVDRAGGHAR